MDTNVSRFGVVEPIPLQPSWRPRKNPVHKRLVSIAKGSAIASAAAAGFGLTAGLLSPADGWLVGAAVPAPAG